MMTDNIVTMPTPMNVLAERYRTAYQRSEKSRAEWIAAVLEMAAAAHEARERFNNDREFGIWIVENGLGFHNDDDRAALINMQRNREITEIALSETKRTSLQHIWREEIAPRVRQLTKPQPEAPQSPKPTENSSTEPETKDEPEKPEPSGRRPLGMTAKTGFVDAPYAAELYQVFREKRARGTLAHLWKGRGGKQAWELIVTAYKAGLLAPNDIQVHEPTLALLFPFGPSAFTRSYRLDNQRQRTEIRDMLLPAMIICRDALMKNPERIREILDKHFADLRAKEHAVVEDKRREQAIGAMEPGQQQLIMYGITVWPRMDDKQGLYDYDQIRAAIWTFRDLLAWNLTTNDNRPGSVGIRMRLSMKWYNEYLIRTDPRRENPIRRIFTLLFWLSKLYEQAPEAECKWPGYPHVEGQW